MHSLEAEHVTALQKKVQNNGAFSPAILETFNSELQLWVRNKLFSISTLCTWHRSQNILTSCCCCWCLFSKLFLCVCILHSFAAALCTISSPLSCQDPNPAVKSPEASVGCKSGDCVLVLQELQKHHWRPWRLDFPPCPNCCCLSAFPGGELVF